MKELFMVLLTQYPDVIMYAIMAIIMFVYGVLMKRTLTKDSIASILGVSAKIKDALIVIFSHTQYNVEKFNTKEFLEKPVLLDHIEDEGKKKMLVATRAFQENKVTKKLAGKLEKAGKLAIFMQTAYKWLKPFFKEKRK